MRLAALTGLLLLLAVWPAGAQETEVGGDVPSVLALSVDEATGFARFPAGADDHVLTLRARITSTERRARLSIADGDVTSGARLGRMASASSLLQRPLEARAGGAFAPLDATLDPLLAEWRGPQANTVARIRLRQRIEAGERPRGTYRKTVLITLSPDVP